MNLSGPAVHCCVSVNCPIISQIGYRAASISLWAPRPPTQAVHPLAGYWASRPVTHGLTPPYTHTDESAHNGRRNTSVMPNKYIYLNGVSICIRAKSTKEVKRRIVCLPNESIDVCRTWNVRYQCLSFILSMRSINYLHTGLQQILYLIDRWLAELLHSPVCIYTPRMRRCPLKIVGRRCSLRGALGRDLPEYEAIDSLLLLASPAYVLIRPLWILTVNPALNLHSIRAWGGEEDAKREGKTREQWQRSYKVCRRSDAAEAAYRHIYLIKRSHSPLTQILTHTHTHSDTHIHTHRPTHTHTHTRSNPATGSNHQSMHKSWEAAGYFRNQLGI